MNPENKHFFNSEEESSENKVEDKEKKEYINLSFVSAADLVRQIESGERYNFNNYQRNSKYAVVFNKNTHEYDHWDLEDDYGEGFSEFLDELPTYYEKNDDKDMKIFFLDTEYDIPLDKNTWGLKDDGEEVSYFLTPDGIHYRKHFLWKGMEDGEEYPIFEINYFDTERLLPDEVRRQAKIAKNKFNWDFKEYSDKEIQKW